MSEFILFVAIIVLIFAIAGYFYWKGNKKAVIKETKKEQERLKEETKKEQEKIIEETKKKQEQIVLESGERIAKADKTIRFYEDKIGVLEQNLEDGQRYTEAELNKLKTEKEKMRRYIREQKELVKHAQDQWKNLKPFPDKNANYRLVISNPFLGGYLCFYKEGVKLEDYPISSLLHRWVWTKHNGRKPKLGHHIHHKDENKFNNDPTNLEEIEGNEHFDIHRYKI